MPMARSYFISTTPRTGSFLLAHALDSTGIAGRPQEYFDPNFENLWLERLGISSDAEFFEKVVPEGTTPNGVFAAKVHWHQFEYLAGKLQSVHGDGPILDLLERTFPGLRVRLPHSPGQGPSSRVVLPGDRDQRMVVGPDRCHGGTRQHRTGAAIRL